jgi:DNA-binding CsgD family transcriptional regulator
VLKSLGCLHATYGAAEQAEAFFSESLGIFCALDNAVGAAQLTANLGELALAENQSELAVERLEAAAAMWSDLGNRVGAVRADVYLAQALLARDELERADAVLRTAFATIRDIDYEQILPAALRAFALLCARRGDAIAAARWYGAEDGLRQALGMELTPSRRAGHERVVAGLRERLTEPVFAAAWAEGRALSSPQILAEVLARAAGSGADSAPVEAPAPGSGLSRRERQVLALLIAGRTDREIAAALFISQRTASTHVGAILRKLNAGTRAEAAVRAVREGLA